MQTIDFFTIINAPKEKVWNILWDKKNYEKWTSAFTEGSTVITDWKEGSKVLFLDSKGSGMVSKVLINRPNEYMSFEHLGFVKDNIEDTTSDEVKKWSGAKENYTLTENNGVTTLAVDMNITEDHKDYFVKTWPNALELVKKLAEQ